MEQIIAACQEIDWSWLPPTVEGMTLTMDNHWDKDKDRYYIFHYENDRHWRWEALYDQEVKDYTVHISGPLMTFVDIQFIRPDLPDFVKVLQERIERGIVSRLVRPEEYVIYGYTRKGWMDWDYTPWLPASVEGFTLDIQPHKPMAAINGSYIMASYGRGSEPTGLLLFYNTWRDECFAELRYQNYPEINHQLDAITIPELEMALSDHLAPILHELAHRQ